ncbi:MAG: hypothetical protein OEX97_05500, partial [Acidimicrobiia bacterium]|nr:hypothetical protein [Acidimicrobiia bacterium]
MTTCKNCQAELTAGYDFCLACGMPVPTDVAVPDMDGAQTPEIVPPPPPAGDPSILPPPPYLPPPPPVGQDAPPVYSGAPPVGDERTWSIA